MATPHDDTAPPSAPDYPSEEDIVELLTLCAEDSNVPRGVESLVHRVVRAYRALSVRLEAANTWIKLHEAESREIDQIRREWFERGEREGHARGRREAVEEACALLDRFGDEKGDSVLHAAADWIRDAERARGGK